MRRPRSRMVSDASPTEPDGERRVARGGRMVSDACVAHARRMVIGRGVPRPYLLVVVR